MVATVGCKKKIFHPLIIPPPLVCKIGSPSLFLVIPAKKSVNFVVAFRPLEDTFPIRGKLVVSCVAPGDPDKKIEWVYYLRGLKVEGKER
jgi:hypothetical protein